MESKFDYISWSEYMEYLKGRNEKLIEEAEKGDLTYEEIGEKFGITRARVLQILKKNDANVPMQKGMKKYENWGKKISMGREANKKKVDNITKEDN